MNPEVEELIPRRIVRLVGVGGMGSVYEAWDDRLERRVALKILHPHLTADPAHRDRLLREARLAARVEHEGVVRIYAVHEYEGGAALEMQFVEGTPLHQLLASRPFTPEQAADLLDQVLRALGACHERGIVHGDLKPGNLLVTGEGRVLLADFGISRAFLELESDAPSMTTLSATVWGTPQYWPPEAWDGALPSPGWDLYALGILVYEALMGALPFRSDTPAVLMRDKLARAERSISAARTDLSPEFAGLIDGLNAHDPEARPKSVAEALRRLHQTPEYVGRAPSTQSLTHKVARTPREASSVGRGALPPIFATGASRAEQKGPTQRMRWALVGAFLLLGLGAIAAFRANQKPEGIAPLEIPPAGAAGEVLDLFVAQGQAFFSYDDGFRGRELWFADATGRTELVADITPGAGSSNPSRFFTQQSGGLFFAAETLANGQEPWTCSTGDTSSASMLKDIIPGPMSSNPIPVASWDSTYMFYATTLQYGTELWLTNGQPEQTGLLEDIRPGSGESWAISPNVAPDALGAYFVAYSGTPYGYALWRFTYADGSLHVAGRADKFAGEMQSVGDTLFIALPDKIHGAELWHYRPEFEDTKLLADIWEGSGASNPQQFFVWKDRLYFQASTEAHGRELWCSDGTPEGTFEVADMAPGTDDGDPYGFVGAPDLLFFRGGEMQHGKELWVTDGTAEGTRMVYDIRPGVESSSPYNLAVIGEYLFFTANDVAHGEELWCLRIADTNSPPRMVSDLWHGPDSAEPHDLKQLDEHTGIFAYKTPTGDGLMRLTLDGGEIALEPYRGLPAPERKKGE